MKSESAKAKKPYVKFYGRDWLGDSQLRMCSPAEKGVWIDLLCLMMGGDPYGHLAVNGVPICDENVARVIGVDVQTYRDHLAKLESLGIPSRTSKGVLYSRRLVFEYQRFAAGSKYGKRGGNPALLNPREDKDTESIIQNPESKGDLKGGVKGKKIQIIMPFESEEFKTVWGHFLEHRKSKKKKMTDYAQMLAFKKLPKDEYAAIAWIKNAILKGWDGIYEPKDNVPNANKEPETWKERAARKEHEAELATARKIIEEVNAHRCEVAAGRKQEYADYVKAQMDKDYEAAKATIAKHESKGGTNAL